MVNLIAPPTVSHIQFWPGLGPYEEETTLNRQARQQLLERRDRRSGLHWVWASYGEVPANAVKCSDPGEPDSFIGRALHVGAVTPGCIDPRRKACCIPWGGDEHEKRLYEVLCTPGSFISVTPGNTEVLLNATSVGVSEQGEPLYAGRVRHDNIWISGKVQRSHGVCYISHKGKELGFREYQVFVANRPEKLRDSHIWVSSLELPPNVFLAGTNQDGRIYVGRTRHRNSMLPGTIDPVTQQCHVTWGSEEQKKNVYEYLCNCQAKFVPTRYDIIPVGAIRGGYSEFGEPLFIGRAQPWEGHQVIGKVHPSHGVCYIPMRAAELDYNKYEILVLDD